MKDGTYRYHLEMSTPLGIRRGNLQLVVLAQRAEGKLTMFTRTLPIVNGHCGENRIRFCGEMRTLASRIPYSAEGILKSGASRMELVFITAQGAYSAVGSLEAAGKRTVDIP